MRINPEHLMTFSVVAEYGSVSKAAEVLNLSQPAVSGQLRTLQEQIGQPLYTRRARGVVLTDAGERLLPYAQAVNRNVQEVAEQISDLQKRPTRVLRVGVSFALTARAVAVVRQATSVGLQVKIVSGLAATLVEQVANSSLDAALVVAPPGLNVQTLDVYRVGEDELKLILPPGHVLADQGYVPLPAARHETFLWSAPGSGVRRQAERLLEAAGMVPAQSLELGSLWAVREALLTGDGVAILPVGFVRRELGAGQLAAVGIEAPHVSVSHLLVTAPAAVAGPEVQTLVGLMTGKRATSP